jgi:hypothetical protein
MNKSDRIYCETHKCAITVSGCLLRQKVHNNPPEWMYNRVPMDPKCDGCDQGRAVKKGKYTIYKEVVLKESIETKDVLPKRGPGRPPKKRGRPPTLAEELMQEKTCSVCGKTYPATREHFRGHKATPDGLENRCKSCIGKTNILELDFSGRTNLLDKLSEMAAAEYRTPELQLMAMIAKEV